MDEVAVTDNEELCRSLHDLIDRRFGAPAAALPLPIVVAEVTGWTHPDLTLEGYGNRALLADEVRAADAVLGPRLRGQVHVPLNQFRAAVETWSTGKEDPDLRRQVARAGQALANTLDRPEVRQAAWDDLVASARSATDLRDAATLVDQLSSLLEATGWEADKWLEKLDGVLCDVAWHVLSAETHTGRRDPPKNWPSGQQRAGFRPGARLDLARGLVALTGQRHRSVVWLSYLRAQLDQDVLEAGPVTFYRSTELKRRLADASTQEAAEMLDTYGSAPPVGPRIALVRVELADQHAATARANSEQLVEALLAPARLAVAGRVWRRSTWTRWRWGDRGGTAVSMTPDEIADIEREFDYHRASGSLTTTAARFAAGLARRAPFDPLLAAALVSRAAAHKDDDQNQMLLLSRSVELAIASARVLRCDLDEILLDSWAQALCRNNMRAAAVRAIGRDDGSHRFDPDLERLGREVEADSGAETWTNVTSFAAAEKVIDELIDQAEHIVERRNREDLRDMLRDDDRYLTDVETLRADGELLAGRRRRARNALTHGNPLDHRVLARVLEFATFHADFALDIAIRSAEASPVQSIADTRADITDYLTRLRVGVRPIDAMD